MIYQSASEWREAPAKRVLLFGMSGLGKTHISRMLRSHGGWFHYSVDYRIGTRYLGERIADNLKREAMKVPLLRELLLTDAVNVSSNISFDNLAPLSTYLGKPGSPDKGGLEWSEYLRRQALHRAAESDAMRDTEQFIVRAKDLYGYPNFVCDSSGSFCEIVDPQDPDDPILKALYGAVLMIWIEGDTQHTQDLIKRFDTSPKPMCYQDAFLQHAWATYLDLNQVTSDEVDPDAFIRWTYAQALAHRQPRYQSLAENWGLRISADALATVSSPEDFTDVVAAALDAKA